MDTKKKNTKPQASACGCEGMTRGGMFLPGHDAKLKRALIEEALGGSKRAENRLEKMGWKKFLDAKREKANKPQKSEKSAPVAEEPRQERRRPGRPRKRAEEPGAVEAEPATAGSEAE